MIGLRSVQADMSSAQLDDSHHDGIYEMLASTRPVTVGDARTDLECDFP